MVLRGERIILRPVELSDIDRLLNINDEEVRQYLLSVFPLNKIREEEWVKNLYTGQRDIVFAIAMAETNQLVGTTGLHSIDWVNRCAEFGIAVTDKSYWNSGLGTQATQLTLRYAFEYLNMNRVQLRVYEYNHRAIHVYEKCGFVREGILRKARYLKGEYYDVIVMGILAKEYFSKRSSAQYSE
ncbi:MAG: GCN5-related N-acetyltransferase [Thermotoga sp. 50_1627]|uniref:GNAT family N-acetyltransferase n=1 Tax=Pseudothermotoga sp. TaxID=2033661 RepID=UPI00076C4083|nr:MAG: GCN5-related N-acetyltransferase [Thermotoga sp. 50_64]KUK24722.1 MAG: GCN5-related N-acetyltransferase [Thermotoga sp. 50_1627]MBC7116514.1 GNAT family N-acetyltransferase [Pseudothermotoga sp.]MDK2923793.1 [ribosomal protein S5]-alanine N-acetyltransferase [Pseudothermotoga sp.]HBT40371.1 N-acetyltransferase [Pseudothermotoga sp.]